MLQKQYMTKSTITNFEKNELLLSEFCNKLQLKQYI